MTACELNPQQPDWTTGEKTEYLGEKQGQLWTPSGDCSHFVSRK